MSMAPPHRIWSFWVCQLLAVGACLLAACSLASPKVVPVSGRVTHKGEPLAGATVTFQPARGNRSDVVGSVGRTNAEGRYELRLVEPDVLGAVVGRHLVTISTATVAPGDDAARPSGERAAKRWRDGSESFVVPQGGTDRADFEIE
jgi:hypothetical protein